jgi:hypothetical protein
LSSPTKDNDKDNDNESDSDYDSDYDNDYSNDNDNDIYPRDTMHPLSKRQFIIVPNSRCLVLGMTYYWNDVTNYDKQNMANALITTASSDKEK